MRARKGHGFLSAGWGSPAAQAQRPFCSPVNCRWRVNWWIWTGTEGSHVFAGMMWYSLRVEKWFIVGIDGLLLSIRLLFIYFVKLKMLKIFLLLFLVTLIITYVLSSENVGRFKFEIQFLYHSNFLSQKFDINSHESHDWDGSLVTTIVFCSIKYKAVKLTCSSKYTLHVFSLETTPWRTLGLTNCFCTHNWPLGQIPSQLPDSHLNKSIILTWPSIISWLVQFVISQ